MGEMLEARCTQMAKEYLAGFWYTAWYTAMLRFGGAAWRIMARPQREAAVLPVGVLAS